MDEGTQKSSNSLIRTWTPEDEEWSHSQDISEICKALVLFQTEQSSIKMDQENPYHKYKYATLTALVEGTKEARKKAKLAVTQLLNMSSVTTVLLHESGQWISCTYKIEPTDSKGMSKAQDMGAAITYARRYAYAAILGLVSDEDTDGADPKDPAAKKKGAEPKSPPKQEAPKVSKDLVEMIEAAETTEELTTIWNSLKPENQNNSEVISLFKQARIKLANNGR